MNKNYQKHRAIINKLLAKNENIFHYIFKIKDLDSLTIKGLRAECRALLWLKEKWPNINFELSTWAEDYNLKIDIIGYLKFRGKTTFQVSTSKKPTEFLFTDYFILVKSKIYLYKINK